MLRNVSVREVMNGDYVGVSESDDLGESVELMLAEDADVGVVLRGTDPVGVLTETDALGAFLEERSLATTTVGAAMTTDVPTIRPDRGLHEARDRMTTVGTNWLVVTAGEQPLGVLTEHDLLAGSTIGTEPAPEEERETDAVVMTPSATAAGADTESASQDSFQDQGICEICGALTGDLAAFNGRLRCADCRDV